MAAHPADIVDFWRQAGAGRWFEKDPAFDEAIRLKFEPTHHAAARGEYDGWMGTPEGALALVILLDQFPRNLYRGSGHQFATDPLARKIAAEAIDRGHDRAFGNDLRSFFYLPYAHSEAMADQDRGVALCQAQADEANDPELVKWAFIHRFIVERYGHFPHRNRALGRETTPEEQAFLDHGGFAG
jgi:uncharacterized protein (DUF924 family)